MISYSISEGINGDAIIPGDKSISHRSIIIPSISNGVTEINNILKSEDVLHTLNAFKALNEDYEEYETEFFKKLHEKNILDGSRKWWEFNKVLSSNVTTESSTAGTPTHSTIGVFGRERSSEEMEGFWNNLTFEDRMMIKNGLASREMLGRYQLKLLMFK